MHLPQENKWELLNRVGSLAAVALNGKCVKRQYVIFSLALICYAIVPYSRSQQLESTLSTALHTLRL